MKRKKLNFSLGLFTEDLGIDLGTVNTMICSKSKGIILNEPSVVAVKKKTKEIYEVGTNAEKMLGRTPVNLEVIKPLKNGVVADYEITEKMLRAFYNRVNAKKLFTTSRVVICIPAGVTQVEKRTVIDVTREAGAKEAYLIEEPMAAAIGAGIDIFEPKGNLIVDIGGGTTEIAIISLGGVVNSSSIKIGGNKFNDAIMQYIKDKYELLIGEKTAEEIKMNIGTAVDLDEKEKLSIEISGRSVQTGLPQNLIITSVDAKEALEDYIKQIVEEIKIVLERTPPELASDIKLKGMVLAGGGALIRGLDKKISEILHVKVHVVEEPLNAVISGIGGLLKSFNQYKEVLISPETDY